MEIRNELCLYSLIGGELKFAIQRTGNRAGGILGWGFGFARKQNRSDMRNNSKFHVVNLAGDFIDHFWTCCCSSCCLCCSCRLTYLPDCRARAEDETAWVPGSRFQAPTAERHARLVFFSECRCLCCYIVLIVVVVVTIVVAAVCWSGNGDWVRPLAACENISQGECHKKGQTQSTERASSMATRFQLSPSPQHRSVPVTVRPAPCPMSHAPCPFREPQLNDLGAHSCQRAAMRTGPQTWTCGQGFGPAISVSHSPQPQSPQ